MIDSCTADAEKSIRRRRECLQCRTRFTTYERVEDPVRLTVIKNDGQRVPWARAKILVSLERACFKRPVPDIELRRIVDDVEEDNGGMGVNPPMTPSKSKQDTLSCGTVRRCILRTPPVYRQIEPAAAVFLTFLVELGVCLGY